MILLQTVPTHIQIEELEEKLLGQVRIVLLITVKSKAGTRLGLVIVFRREESHSVIKVQAKRSTAHINVFFECCMKTMNAPLRYCLPAVVVFAFMRKIYSN